MDVTMGLVSSINFIHHIFQRSTDQRWALPSEAIVNNPNFTFTFTLSIWKPFFLLFFVFYQSCLCLLCVGTYICQAALNLIFHILFLSSVLIFWSIRDSHISSYIGFNFSYLVSFINLDLFAAFYNPFQFLLSSGSLSYLQSYLH